MLAEFNPALHPLGLTLQGEVPAAAEGLAVSRFAEGLDHPRILYTLPNGDVLAVLTRGPKFGDDSLTDRVANWFMDLAGASGASPNKIILLRDSDGDGVAETRKTLLAKGLDHPSGMAWHDGTLYVANHDALLAFAYQPGTDRVESEPRKLMDLAPAGNHWMRNIAINPDGTGLQQITNFLGDGIPISDIYGPVWDPTGTRIAVSMRPRMRLRGFT